MGVPTDQRAGLEGRLLTYVQQRGSVRSAGEAILGARLRRTTGLRLWHVLKQRGRIRQLVDGRFDVPGEHRADGVMPE